MTRRPTASAAALGASLLLGACAALAPPVAMPPQAPPPLHPPAAWQAPMPAGTTHASPSPL